MKVLSFNVRCWYRDTNKSVSTYWRNRARKMKHLIEKENPDVIFFQEMLFPMSLYIPKEYKKITLMTSHSIYVRKNRFKLLNTKWHLRFCSAKVKDKVTNQKYNLFCVHTHWNENIVKDTVNKLMKQMGNTDIISIAGGDWNNFPETITPLINSNLFLITGTSETFVNYTNEKSRGILDFFVSNINKFKNFSIASTDFSISDHLPVILQI